MSRAHMLYDNQPLQQEGVKVSKWTGKWNPEELQKGVGVLMEGVFLKRITHSIQDTSGTKCRYVVFHIEFKHGCQRKYDVHGKEVEPNFGQTGLVRTGYLQSSYKTEAKGTPDTLDFAEVQRRLRSPLADFVPASHSQTLCLWGEEATYNHVELEYGGPVRLKTKGNSPFIESLTRLETDQKAHSSNYTGGEKAGQSWTDRVIGVKQTKEVPASLPQDQQEGVDEDEWVRKEVGREGGEGGGREEGGGGGGGRTSTGGEKMVNVVVQLEQGWFNPPGVWVVRIFYLPQDD